ncbi:MAG: YbaK/EbsC family protein [Candidatus Woesearchaeota archaeon]
MNVLEEILSLLNQKKVEYQHLTHDHVHTSEDAAKIRGNSLSQAAKAIILKTKAKGEYRFIQVVLQGDKKIDLKTLRKHIGARSINLATPNEVLKITSCTIGSVPPFGILFDIDVYVDESLFDEEYIFFSAGTHNDSIKLKSNDYLTVVSPISLRFSVSKDAS